MVQITILVMYGKIKLAFQAASPATHLTQGAVQAGNA